MWSPSDDDARARIAQLEEQLRQLRNENALLIDVQEHVALPGLVATHVQTVGEPGAVLRSALERIAILRDIAVCAAGDVEAGAIVIRECEVSLPGVTPPSCIRPAPHVMERLARGAVLLSGHACAEAGVTFGDAAEPREVLFVPFSSRAMRSACLVFADHRGDGRIAGLEDPVRGVADALVARLDNIALLDELQQVNTRLEQFVAELDQRVAERTAALIEGNRRLEEEIARRERSEAELLQAQKLESVGRLAGGIAHDFNNLLTTILGITELALSDLPEGHPLAAEFSTIRDAGRLAADLTARLLAFSRHQRLAMANVAIDDLVFSFAPMITRLIGEDVECRLDLGAPGLDVFADRVQLQQVLMNLAVNARDAMPGGGTLTFRTRPSTLQGDAGTDLAENPCVRLTVSDTGTGMPPEVAARAFDPFFTTKSRGAGTGLGLSTAFGIVRQHGGTIALDSTVGVGTSIEIRLPAVPSATEHERTATSPAGPAAGHGRGSATILVVDDDPSVLRTIERMLSSLGYGVLTAASGHDAMTLLEQHPRPALVLTDLVMPGMGGEALAAQCRAANPSLPVLFMSGYAADLAAGTPFIRKPLVAAELAAAIEGALLRN